MHAPVLAFTRYHGALRKVQERADTASTYGPLVYQRLKDSLQGLEVWTDCGGSIEQVEAFYLDPQHGLGLRLSPSAFELSRKVQEEIKRELINDLGRELEFELTWTDIPADPPNVDIRRGYMLVVFYTPKIPAHTRQCATPPFAMDDENARLFNNIPKASIEDCDPSELEPLFCRVGVETAAGCSKRLF